MSYKPDTKKDTAMQSSLISYEISRRLMDMGIRPGNETLIAAYLLYRVSRMNKPCTWAEIESNKLGLREDLWLEVKEKIGSHGWEQLESLSALYTPEEFSAAVLQSDLSQLGAPDESLTTPSSLISLALGILDIQPGERVIDVCSGVGSFLHTAAQSVPNAEYIGCDINPTAKLIADIRTELLGLNTKIELGDAFSLLRCSDTPVFNKAFSNYPFGMKIRNLRGGAALLEKLARDHPQLSKATSSDWIFNALLCDLLAKHGKAIGIMTNGSTWNSIDAPMRQHFVEHGLVEAVIALPPKMFSYTPIPTTMILLSRGNESVRMIDATKLCQEGRRMNNCSEEDIRTIIEALHKDSPYSKIIHRSELYANNFALSPTRYLEEKIYIRHSATFDYVIKNISRGAPCTAKQLDQMVSDTATNMQYLMLGNIQDGLIDNKLPYLSYIEPKYEKYCLKDNSLILSKNGYPYKVAVAHIPEGQKVLANGNLYIIELDEQKVNPYYLKAFFESDLGTASLKSISVGATIPNIGVDQLKKLSVPVPPMEEQMKFVLKYQAALDEISILKLKLQKATSRLHHIFDEESEG